MLSSARRLLQSRSKVPASERSGAKNEATKALPPPMASLVIIIIAVVTGMLKVQRLTDYLGGGGGAATEGVGWGLRSEVKFDGVSAWRRLVGAQSS